MDNNNPPAQYPPVAPPSPSPPPPPPLSSDMLESQFGPTYVDVLFQQEDRRVIQTRTQAGQVLELSYVQFDPTGAQAYPTVHQTVRGGVSMGKAFRSAGVPFQRVVISVMRFPVSTNMAARFGRSDLAWVLNVDILVGDNVHYATITEVYSAAVAVPYAITPPDPQLIRNVGALVDILDNLKSDARPSSQPITSPYIAR